MVAQPETTDPEFLTARLVVRPNGARELFLFRWKQSRRRELFKHLTIMAANPQVRFTWADVTAVVESTQAQEAIDAKARGQCHCEDCERARKCGQK